MTNIYYHKVLGNEMSSSSSVIILFLTVIGKFVITVSSRSIAVLDISTTTILVTFLKTFSIFLMFKWNYIRLISDFQNNCLCVNCMWKTESNYFVELYVCARFKVLSKREKITILLHRRLKIHEVIR